MYFAESKIAQIWEACNYLGVSASPAWLADRLQNPRNMPIYLRFFSELSGLHIHQANHMNISG